MSTAKENAAAAEVDEKLPLRDLWILPLLSILTVCLCLFSGELVASHFFSSFPSADCVDDDNMIGFRYRPNCMSREKGAEGPWVTNEFNDCGYRTKESCGKRPAGTVRIALLGSSLSYGLNVRYEDTFAQQTASHLTQDLGRHVEVQNLGRPDTSLISTFHQVDEALALKPDILLMAISPYDLERMKPAEMPDRYKPIPPLKHVAANPGSATTLMKLKGLVNSSHLGIAAEHFYYQDTANFARVYLLYGDRADYLRQPFTPAWEARFEALDVLMQEIKARCDAASVALVLVEVPTLAQASLLQMNDLPAKVDPYAMNRRLQEIASGHGIELIDTLDAFKRGPSINQLFYVIDGHINAEGNQLVGDVIAKQLMQHQQAALMADTIAQSNPGQGRAK